MITDYLVACAPALREYFDAAPIPAMILPDAIDDDTAVALRARLDRAGVQRYAIADRGRYAYNAWLMVDELWADVAALASGLAGAPLQIVAVWWSRLGRGDYALVKDDHRRRPAGRHVEVTLDLSTTFSTEAEIVYRDRDQALVVPQIPRMISIVQREETTHRYERPPTLRGGGVEIVRLRLSLAPEASW